jgi:hypothetical protein
MSRNESTTTLISYLDEKLPWSITIRLINFLSWFQLVKPVDSRISQLRQHVNAALEYDSSKESDDSLLTAYTEYFSFLKDYLNDDPRMPEAQPTKTLQPNESSKELFINEINTLIDITRKEIAKKHEDPRQIYYRNMMDVCQAKDWKTKLPDFFKTLEAESQLYCAKEILCDAEKSRHDERLQNGSLLAVQLLNYESSDKVSKLFNNLENDVDTKKYLNYLGNCDYELRSKLKSSFDTLRSKKTHSSLGYDAQKKLSSLDRAIANFTSSEQKTWEQSLEKLDTLRESFSASYNETTFTDNSISKLIQDVLICFNNLKQLIELYTSEPCLNEYERREKNAHNKENKQLDERMEFNDKLTKGEIKSISTQRLRELYSKTEEYNDIYNKCKRLGVSFFDATDKKQTQYAIDTRFRANS